jgi:mRNA-degrading endonuclease RelE of RelBE toxin-antitoxin system
VLHKIVWIKKAEKEFAALSQGQRKAISDEIDKLVAGPEPPGSDELEGYSPLRRLKAGMIRAIYDPQAGPKKIRILRIGHRKRGVYHDLQALFDE